jgi:choline dehydrogenase-like flavoprotein
VSNVSTAEFGAPDFDAIVVGAGPAGAAAALELARAGRKVCLVERGPFPGSKNMYGGVVYGRILDTLLPNWWEEAPVQRWVTRRQTMILTETAATTLDVRNEAWGKPPYNGATAYRPDFDSWLAQKAVDAGAAGGVKGEGGGRRRERAAGEGQVKRQPRVGPGGRAPRVQRAHGECGEGSARGQGEGGERRG